MPPTHVRGTAFAWNPGGPSELAVCASQRRNSGDQPVQKACRSWDATQLLAQLQAAGAGSYMVNAAGSGGRLEPVQVPLPVVPAVSRRLARLQARTRPRYLRWGEAASPDVKALEAAINPLRWKENGRDRKVSYADLAHVDGHRWKKKGGLVAFAARTHAL